MYGFFDFGSSEMDPTKDASRGKEILEYYHNYMIDNFPKYDLQSVDELASRYGRITKDLLYENIGLTQRVNSLDMESSFDAMRDLSDHGEGKIPLDWQSYGRALGKEALNPSFWQALQYVSSESAKEISQISQDVGTGVISTLKLSKYLTPTLLWGGAAIGIWLVLRRVTKRI